MLRTFEANFSVALYSLGAYEYPIEEDEGEEDINYSEIIASQTNNFIWCLCNDLQSNYVLKFLKEGYEIFQIYGDVTISDITYERRGKFTCKIDIFDEIEEPYIDSELEEIIEEAIRPSELIEENGIVINNEKYAVDIKLDYYVETYYDEEDDKEEEDDEEEEQEEDEDKIIQDYEYNCEADTSDYNCEEDDNSEE